MGAFAYYSIFTVQILTAINLKKKKGRLFVVISSENWTLP